MVASERNGPMTLVPISLWSVVPVQRLMAAAGTTAATPRSRRGTAAAVGICINASRSRRKDRHLAADFHAAA